MRLLANEFLSKYPDMPEHMNQLGSFVFYRTYSRWLPTKERRETWKEAVTRAVEYNVGISVEQFKRNQYQPPIDKIRVEAEILFDNIFNLRQFLSGRTHWVGGAETGVAMKFPLANFNCSFIDVVEWNDLCDLFYLLLVGTGVGFKCTQENAKLFPPIRTNYELIHSEYHPLDKKERLEHTQITVMENGYAKIYIGDSKEGWVTALKHYITLLTDKKFENIKHIKISYNSIRPKGERLVTFGGTASGHEPMMEMFKGIDMVLKGTLDSDLEPPKQFYASDEFAHWKKVRPIHILDIGNLIGNNVVVGGVRRTAEIFMCDDDDFESINAKKYINDMPNLNHRRMSNNSIAFEKKPTRKELHEIFQNIRINGEPGFINMESAKKRRPNARGLNPCGEVILDSYGVCNLTTVNVRAYVVESEGYYRLNYQGLMQAQALSTRAGIRMTCLDLELPHWDKIHKRDRLIGVSLTGWKDAMDLLEYTEEQEANLLTFLSDVAHSEAVKYSHILRIPTPLLDTTVKPEGTLSQVAGGVSSGLHVSHSPYYIRRIRINANDPLVTVAKMLNWTIQPEVNSDVNNVRTFVIDFPVKSGAKITRAEQTVKEQFDTYFKFQEIYTSHNSSNTITVKEDEWDTAEQIIWDNWDNFIGVTFIPFDGGKYELMPYEEITEEEYTKMKARMYPFDVELLSLYEKAESDKDTENMEACEGNVCPIF